MHKALGRGLSSLLPVSEAHNKIDGEQIIKIGLNKIKPNKYQPRTEFNEEKLKELSESIKQHGLAQPLLVTASAVPGEYELIAGERRLRACKIAGLSDVSCIVRKASEKEKFQLSLIENIQRQDLNAIEEGVAYKRLCDEFEVSHEELAGLMGKNRTVITNSIRLLSLPEEVKDAIIMGVISAGHGKILAGIEDAQKQKALAERIVKEKLTVREIESIASDWKTAISTSKTKIKKVIPELAALCEELQRKFGTKVKIAGSAKKGKIEFHYFSLKELERISSLLKGKKNAK
jgi:ParB family transcriptional regulator, chromosome partitioning protein